MSAYDYDNDSDISFSEDDASTYVSSSKSHRRKPPSDYTPSHRPNHRSPAANFNDPPLRRSHTQPSNPSHHSNSRALTLRGDRSLSSRATDTASDRFSGRGSLQRRHTSYDDDDCDSQPGSVWGGSSSSSRYGNGGHQPVNFNFRGGRQTFVQNNHYHIHTSPHDSYPRSPYADDDDFVPSRRGRGVGSSTWEERSQPTRSGGASPSAVEGPTRAARSERIRAVRHAVVDGFAGEAGVGLAKGVMGKIFGK